MDEKEFWEISDTFRDPKVWWINNNKWFKENVWGEASSYGEVYLNKSMRDKYIR